MFKPFDSLQSLVFQQQSLPSFGDVYRYVSLTYRFKSESYSLEVTQLKIREDSRQIIGRHGRDRVVEADLPFSRQIQPRTWWISRPSRDGRLISPDLGGVSTEISILGVSYIYIVPIYLLCDVTDVIFHTSAEADADLRF